MSALKSNFRQEFLHEVEKLNSVWNDILPKLETISVAEIIQKIRSQLILCAVIFMIIKPCACEKVLMLSNAGHPLGHR